MGDFFRDLAWAVAIGAAALLAAVITMAVILDLKRPDQTNWPMVIVFFGTHLVCAAFQARQRRWRRVMLLLTLPLLFGIVVVSQLGIA